MRETGRLGEGDWVSHGCSSSRRGSEPERRGGGARHEGRFANEERQSTTSAANISYLAELVKLGTGATGAPYLDGCVATAIVCNAYLSGAERAHVRGYLSSKYGVPA